MLRWIALVLALALCPGCAVAAAALAGAAQGLAAGVNSEDGHTCPVDGYSMTPTGRVQTSVYGRMIYEYRCPMGHLAWGN